ncbi:MAG: hypothetical protein ACOCTT_00735, partial [archaeon]
IRKLYKPCFPPTFRMAKIKEVEVLEYNPEKDAYLVAIPSLDDKKTFMICSYFVEEDSDSSKEKNMSAKLELKDEEMELSLDLKTTSDKIDELFDKIKGSIDKNG